MEELITRQQINIDNVPKGWKLNEEGMAAINKVYGHLKSSNIAAGIRSDIPIICKGESCPFIETCYMNELDIDMDNLLGQKCAIEIAEMIDLLERYMAQFKINIMDPDQQTLVSLLKDLIDYEIQLYRADRKMSINGDFLEDRCVGISEAGEPIYNKEISKAVEYKNSISQKKHQILQLLNSTPKDKAGSKVTESMDPSSYAASLLAKAAELEESIDVEIEDVDE